MACSCDKLFCEQSVSSSVYLDGQNEGVTRWGMCNKGWTDCGSMQIIKYSHLTALFLSCNLFDATLYVHC